MYILLLNWTHSLIFEFAVGSSGFGVYKVGYVGHDYVIFAGILGRK